MIPAQIAAKVRQLSTLLDQDEAKAKQYGVDLEACLQQGGKSTGIPALDTWEDGQRGMPTIVDMTVAATEVNCEPTKPCIAPVDLTLIAPDGMRILRYHLFQNVPSVIEKDFADVI